MGETPGTVPPDLSPVKVDENDLPRRLNGRHSLEIEDRQIMSSSPPPMDIMGSPSKAARGSQNPMTSSSARKDNETFHERSRSATAVAPSPELRSITNTKPQIIAHASVPLVEDDDDDDGDVGFDLAKGFAPIARGLGASFGRR
jgi:hypothetical protein